MTKHTHIHEAAQLLRQGKLVAFPTETVYGLGADASNAAAVERIFAVKERPKHHPLIVHLADISMLSAWARDIKAEAHTLALAFWPGPLTMIFKKQPHVLDEVTGGQDTIGIRIPRHPIAKALLMAFGGGIAAPSANKFTHISPTTAAAVFDELHDEVDCILDGGPCDVGLESTILDMSNDEPRILRPGMITAADITQILKQSVVKTAETKALPRAPGSHHLHYAPQTQTHLLDTVSMIAWLSTVKSDASFVVIAHSHALKTVLSATSNNAIHFIAMAEDAKTYAHDLYDTLRNQDHMGYQAIMIEAVPDEPAWFAIADRISKASAKK